MPEFPATPRTVARAGKRYSVWDEYPHRHENPDVEDWDFWSVFEDGWEPYLEQVLSEHLTPERTFLDVGAWWGPVTLLAARISGHVHAVEPDPVARLRLEANVGRLRRKNVTVHSCAVAAGDGPVRIGRRADRRFGDSMTSTIFDGDAVEVQGLTLATLIADAGIADLGLIKMDIEGGEETVLPACVDTIRGFGAPLLLATHTAIVADPDRYLQAVAVALDGWKVTFVDGVPGGNATYLAEPPEARHSA